MSSPMGQNDSWYAMAAVGHLRRLKEAFHMPRDPTFYTHTKCGKDILIGGEDMPPKLNLNKQRPLAVEFCFRYHFDTCLATGPSRV